MPQYNDPPAPDALRYLKARIDQLTTELELVKRSKSAMIFSRGDHAGYPVPYEGQVMIDYATDLPWYYSRGEWRSFGGGGNGIYAIEVFENFTPLIAGDGAFEWEIPEDLDGATLLKVEGYVTTTSSSGSVQVQFRNETTGHDLLTTKLTIDVGDLNSKDSATPAVVDSTYEVVAWGDHINIDVDAAGTGATGLGVVLYFVPLATANIAVQGAKGDPGGITSWTGQWDSGTTYTTGEAVSNNGSSYVAISGSTDVEPGVDVGWETYWMLLAGNQQYTTLCVLMENHLYPLDVGVKAYISVPFAGTLTACTLLADIIGDVELDIQKTDYAGYPGSLASIVSTSPPTLSAAQKSVDTALSGWTTAVAADDVLTVSIVSVDGLRLLSLNLTLRRA
jgi:hypothetical protein